MTCAHCGGRSLHGRLHHLPVERYDALGAGGWACWGLLTHRLYAGRAPSVDSSLCRWQRAPEPYDAGTRFRQLAMPSLLTAKGATMHSSLTHRLYAGCAPSVDSSLCRWQRAPEPYDAGTRFRQLAMPSLLTAKGATMHSSLTHRLYAGCAPSVDSSLCRRQRASGSLFSGSLILSTRCEAVGGSWIVLWIPRAPGVVRVV